MNPPPSSDYPPTDWLGETTVLRTTLSFEALPGRSYQLRGAVCDGELVVWIVDQATGEVVAGDPVEPPSR